MAKKASIVMFSGDLDKALAGMVISTGAVAAGWDVTLFFTFWGINIVRDENKSPGKPKSMVEKMFGWMMPTGANKLKLSTMNMGGMGTSMIKKRMNLKKIKPLREMIKEGKELGVKFLVCDMSMDLMGLQKEEFIDEIDEIVGVGAYLRETKEANMTLFI